MPATGENRAEGVLSRISDARASQFWDKNHLFANQLKHDMEADPEHPRPRCCEEEGILWDLVAVYPRQVSWGKSLPRAAYVDGPVFKAADLPSTLSELLTGKKASEPDVVPAVSRQLCCPKRNGAPLAARSSRCPGRSPAGRAIIALQTGRRLTRDANPVRRSTPAAAP